MSINKDQVKCRTNQVIGKVKETVGEAVGDKKLQISGAIEKSVGSVQAKVGDLKSAIAKS